MQIWFLTFSFFFAAATCRNTTCVENADSSVHVKLENPLKSPFTAKRLSLKRRSDHLRSRAYVSTSSCGVPGAEVIDLALGHAADLAAHALSALQHRMYEATARAFFGDRDQAQEDRLRIRYRSIERDARYATRGTLMIDCDDPLNHCANEPPEYAYVTTRDNRVHLVIAVTAVR